MTAESLQFLKNEYLTIVRREFGVSAEAVSDEPCHPSWRGFTSLLQVERHFRDPGTRHPPSVKIWNGYWQLLLRDAREALAPEMGVQDAHIYIGEVLHADFNAHVEHYGDGRFLILINRGLELFIYRLCIVLVASMRLRFAPGGQQSAVIEPTVSMPRARAIVYENLEKLYDARHEMPMRQLTEGAALMSANYTYALLEFVIAHELGHIVQVLGPGTAADQDEEFVADEHALTAMGRLGDVMARRHGVSRENGSRMALEAPFMVFRVIAVLEQFAREHGMERWETHPAAQMRKNAVMALLHKRGAPRAELEWAEERWRHICELTEPPDRLNR